MAGSIVKINNYLEKVRKEIARLEIVNECSIYAKQINFDTRKVMGINIANNKATCFIEQVGAVNTDISGTIKRLILDYTINVYIVAKNNRSSKANERAGSTICNEAQDQIMALLFDEDFDFNIEEARILTIDLIDDTSEVYNDYSIYYITYAQKLPVFERK